MERPHEAVGQTEGTYFELQTRTMDGGKGSVGDPIFLLFVRYGGGVN